MGDLLNMGMSGFASGMDDGLKTYLSNQQNQEGMAFKLKLQNAQIEGQLANEKAMAEFNKATPETTANIFGAAGQTAEPGQRASVPELGLLAGIEKAKISAKSRMTAGQNRGMTVADFEDARGVKTGMPSDRWLNPTEVMVWQSRLSGEKPTAEVMNTYKQQMDGSKLIEQLERMRNDALTEVFEGPMKGRAANLAVAADEGWQFPKAAAYLKFVDLNKANIAHMSGEIGRLAEGDIDRAGNMATTFKTSQATSKILFGETRKRMADTMGTAEYLFPSLKRLKENEAAGMGIKSQAAAEHPTAALDFKAIKANYDKLQAEKKAEAAKKTAGN